MRQQTYDLRGLRALCVGKGIQPSAFRTQQSALSLLAPFSLLLALCAPCWPHPHGGTLVQLEPAVELALEDAAGGAKRGLQFFL